MTERRKSHKGYVYIHYRVRHLKMSDYIYKLIIYRCGLFTGLINECDAENEDITYLEKNR